VFSYYASTNILPLTFLKSAAHLQLLPQVMYLPLVYSLPASLCSQVLFYAQFRVFRNSRIKHVSYGSSTSWHLLSLISGNPCYNNADKFITNFCLIIKTSEKLNDANHGVIVAGKHVKTTMKQLLPLPEVSGYSYLDNR